MEAIARIIGNRLKSYDDIGATENHPDEDTISAFVEGRLEEVESSNIVSHLIVCRTCRHITAQLSQLDDELTPEADEASGGLLGDLVAQLIPRSEDDAVFAYQEPTEPKALDSDQSSGEALDQQGKNEPD